MKKIVKKSYLKGYKPSAKYIGGAVIATTVIVGGYFGFQALRPKPTPVKSVTPTKTTTVTQKPSLDGRYVGNNSSVAQGISAADVTVTGNTLSGKATYVGQYNATAGLTVTGTVDTSDTERRGNIYGTFSGPGTVMGQPFTVTGTYQGRITSGSMNVSYSATGAGQTYPGQITLSKQ